MKSVQTKQHATRTIYMRAFMVLSFVFAFMSMAGAQSLRVTGTVKNNQGGAEAGVARHTVAQVTHLFFQAQGLDQIILGLHSTCKSRNIPDLRNGSAEGLQIRGIGRIVKALVKGVQVPAVIHSGVPPVKTFASIVQHPPPCVNRKRLRAAPDAKLAPPLSIFVEKLKFHLFCAKNKPPINLTGGL